MTIKVIGAGFGRTGTLSLKMALETLGFDKCYHMMEVFGHPEHLEVWSAGHRGESVDWDELFEGYQASVDWPSCNLWREQMARYPEAKVVLSIRDPESWYTSIMATIYESSRRALESTDSQTQQGGKWAHEIIWDPIFDRRMEDKDHCIKVFLKHQETVKEEVPADRLLVFQASDGWVPLCEFLNLPVPAEGYPRVNTTAEFNERTR